MVRLLACLIVFTLASPASGGSIAEDKNWGDKQTAGRAIRRWTRPNSVHSGFNTTSYWFCFWRSRQRRGQCLSGSRVTPPWI